MVLYQLSYAAAFATLEVIKENHILPAAVNVSGKSQLYCIVKICTTNRNLCEFI